ncbi:MAG: hypothetical protein PGN33_14140 [Methylobacterium radiotolerans]
MTRIEVTETELAFPHGVNVAGYLMHDASEAARKDFRTAYDRDENADDPICFGIGEVETPVGTLLCEWRYRTVSRRNGTDTQPHRDWWLNGERTTGAAFLRAMKGRN